jgi:CelD/BcsL family acetyltransferase involved in cellulose biosynthesis
VQRGNHNMVDWSIPKEPARTAGAESGAAVTLAPYVVCMQFRTNATASALSAPAAAAHRSPPRLRVFTGERAVQGVSQRWNELAADCAPTEHFIWCSAAAEAFAGDAPRVYALERDGRICALAPLVVRGTILPRLEVAGACEVSEPCDFLHEDRASLRELVAALAGSGTPLHVPRVFADSPLLGELRAACGARALTITRPAPGCPRIVLDESWREPERRLTSARRNDLRRAHRIAEGVGRVTLEAITPSTEELGPLLEEAFRVEAAGWKGKTGSALSHNPKVGVFFRRYAAAACERGILRVFFMRIEGRAVAMVLAAECAGRLWTLKIGYDEEFRRCSPGTLLTRHTIAWAAERRLRSYEFLGTAAWWTAQWTKDVRACVSLRIYPMHPRCLAALAVDVLGWGRRKALARRAW